MESRERVVKAINHDYPDRPPISHAILPSAILKHGQALQDILKDVHEDFGWDFLPDVKPENYPPYYKKGRGYDGFGTGQRNPQVDGCPLWVGRDEAKLGCRCTKLLLAEGKHTVRVDIFKGNWKRTGNLQVERDGRIRREEESHRAGRVARGTVTCTSSPALQSLYQ